ncbi:MAG TPA: hypothetical protein VLQ80_08545 [Candidatus Saccharimonadia bacterium]|nr:hypothetical protein [Candidatus Saccharimonadia bacterium]
MNITDKVLDEIFGAPIGVVINSTMSGFIGGFITGLALRMVEPSLQWKHVLMISVGWAIGRTTYEPVAYLGFHSLFTSAIYGSLVGATGGSMTFWQLRCVRSKS